MIILAQLAGVGMIAIGALAFSRPDLFTKYTELKGTTPMGLGELRGVVGGMYTGLGLSVVVAGAPDQLCLALAIGWIGVLLGKAMAITQDKLTFNKATPGIVLDSLMALCFLFNAGLF